MKINFTFFGTPDVSLETLEILKSSGYIPECIVTAPDAPQGRGLRVQASPVSIFAQQNNIPCLKPEKIDEDFLQSIKKYGSSIFIVVAYGKILPQDLIDIPNKGVFNIHFSLLPKYRGASPVQSAILNGETETGVTIQKMIFKLDAGDIVAQEIVPIGPNETTPELLSRLIKIGGSLLSSVLPIIADEKTIPIKQNEADATSCKKIAKESGLLELSDSGVENYNKYRAYKAWPRTYFIKDLHDKKIRIIISEAKLENENFIPVRVIPEGKKEISYEDFLRNRTKS